MADTVPDETTILNFRHLLEKHALHDVLFEEINSYLGAKGFILKKGTLVDATIIHAPTSRKNADKERDPEMSFTKKHGRYYFGMKGHIGVDLGSGIVHTVICTTASASDYTIFESLLHGEELGYFGDAGYCSDIDKKAARDAGIFCGVLDRAKRGHSLSSSQKKRNRKLSKIRSKVEHAFALLKTRFGYVKTRYRGLYKNGSQLKMMFGLLNLYKMRRQLAFG